MPAPRPAELLDAEAVATQLGVSVRQVQALASRRQIAHVRVGRLLRFTPEGVAAGWGWLTVEGDQGCEQSGALRRYTATAEGRAALVS